MTRKFNEKEFIERFVQILKLKLERGKGWPQIFSLSETAKDVCREKGYSMSGSRWLMTEAIQCWWDGLPNYKPRDYQGSYKILFGVRVRIGSTMGPSFIALRYPGLSASGGLLTFNGWAKSLGGENGRRGYE